MQFRAEEDYRYALGVMPLRAPIWFAMTPYGKRIDGMERKIRMVQEGRAKLQRDELDRVVSQAVTGA